MRAPLILIAGSLTYAAIPKESNPDVAFPYIYTAVVHEGISPEDSERLLLRPVETQLKSVNNVKEMRSTAYEGGAYVLLEFQAGDIRHFFPRFQYDGGGPSAEKLAVLVLRDQRGWQP